MTSTTNPNVKNKLLEQLARSRPFKYLQEQELEGWLAAGEIRHFPVGKTLLRSDELPAHVFVVVKGEVRLLGPEPGGSGSLTLERREKGQLLGFTSLLRAGPCEWVIASTEVEALALPASRFIELVRTNPEFAEAWFGTTSLPEAYLVGLAACLLVPERPAHWQNDLQQRAAAHALACALEPGKPFEPPQTTQPIQWFLSTEGVPGARVGQRVCAGDTLSVREGFQLPYRLIGLSDSRVVPASKQVVEPLNTSVLQAETEPRQLDQLGILEADHLNDSQRYPVVRGRGQLAEAMAVVEMIAQQQGVPFRRDAIQKVLEQQFRRDKGLSLELMAGLCELIGLNTQLGEVESRFLASVEGPSIWMLEGIPVVQYGMTAGRAVIGHPHHGLQKVAPANLARQLGDRFRLAIPRRIADTPTSRFGWHWFTPLLKKYRVSLAMVFIASLLAQLFGLGIPLLLQQIIDKVLSQGNLSSLNVLGSAMVALALFRGVLMALRTYIFVDTTDRIDLTLGSAVIDRLLSLPLSFFDQRPVGELSQRLGELNTIRGFLTGTALISVLNIIFASTYLVVLLIYSPLLTAVALSVMPVYLILVFGIAPLYKALIRKRAVAQARTQSHLIEVLSGIQTVKAQHFELTARWKWQDRYRQFVEEGFKSSVLGATSNEIGQFLNQLSGLLVLWVGMSMVLNGEFTLGMLIAFRIIANSVTGPLLQLSGLYQGFQGVQLAMERLRDILDQNPELKPTEDGLGQIALPPIKGDVRFEAVRFRFTRNGPYQVDDLTVTIPRGNFVGIVGQSGSGKSTLMKLLPRLYEPESGRIFIDDYDIAKVDLSSLRRQIGIVPQDSLLFEGSISENIALNDPQASDEAIIEAARIACAHDFIMGLGQGYATKLAERGSNLSGGQRQRIAIARTILSNPQLLVMDEATSALDFNTERQLCLNLQVWAEDRTVFFITHRLSTVHNSDLILVMHDGRLVESGQHETLMAEEGRYAVLYRQQQQQS